MISPLHSELCALLPGVSASGRGASRTSVGCVAGAVRLPGPLRSLAVPGAPRLSSRATARGRKATRPERIRWRRRALVDDGKQRERRRHGSLEAAVLQFLERSDGPRTAGEVRAWLNEPAGEDLAYTTVVTVLSRLHDKGLLDRLKQGRSFAYVAVTDEARLTAQRLRTVLERGPDREAVLAHFVGDLSPSDAALLRRLIGPEATPEAAR